MREIKFRYIGRNLSGKWFKKIFTLLQIEQREVFKWVKENDIVPSSIKHNQYTGLKDKNKIEIYEGDIIINEYSQEKYTVIWNDYMCSFMFKNIKTGKFVIIFNTGLEEIDNIQKIRNCIK